MIIESLFSPVFSQKHQVHLFEALNKIMWDLIKCRQDLISGTLTQVRIFGHVRVRKIIIVVLTL